MAKPSSSCKSFLFQTIQRLDQLAKKNAVTPSSVGHLYLFLAEVLPDMLVAEQDPKEKLLNTALKYIKQNEALP